MSKQAWRDEVCIVAATGQSLSEEQARLCEGHYVIVVNDAYKIFPNANTLYAADIKWWRHHNGCPNFKGEKLICTYGDRKEMKIRESLCKEYGLKFINGRKGSGFSLDPEYIHYGTNSGFQAVNVAIQRLFCPILLLGFDMYGTHFFGEHPKPLRETKKYDRFIDYFHQAKRLNPEINIINCTPHSRLQSFPMLGLEEALDACRKFKSKDFNTTSD